MRKGVLFAVGAYLMWGIFPLYWPLLAPAGALEILAHRMVWSAVVMALVITALRSWRTMRTLSIKTWIMVALAATFVSINWGVYIYAVNNGHVIEASLGYFINPLVVVGLSVVALRERLSLLQWTSLAIATCGVVLTALGSHGFPYLAVILAVSFALYGLIKRIIKIPATISLFGESAVLTGPALGFLFWLQIDGHAHFIGYGAGHITVMVGAGIVTALPLLLFGASAHLIPLSVLGFLQYLNPLTQFMLGVFWAHESMSANRWAGFVVIWVALALLSADMVMRSRRAGRWARRARRGVMQSATVTHEGDRDGLISQ